MEIIRKTISLAKGLDDAGKGTAIIATLGVVDHDDDVIMPGAFGTQSASMIPGHNWSSIPLGKAQIREEGDKAFADFTLNLDIEAGREWHKALKFDMENGDPVQEWSFGYTIIKRSFEDRDNRQVRLLEKLQVHEVSPVVAGAGIDTRTVVIKNADQSGAMPKDLLQIKSEQVAGRSVKLSDHLKLALWDIGEVIKRCQEVREIREKDGRNLSPERYEELGSIMLALATLEEIGKSLVIVLQKGDDPETINLLASEFARFEFFGGATLK